MSDLTGKVAFVARASSASGHAIIAKFKSAGAKVCGVDSDAADLSVSVDATAPESWDQAFQTCRETLGGLDILVIETVGQPSESIEEISLADFKAAHRDMVIPAFLAQNRGVMAMRAAGGSGAIVHITPAAARSAMEKAVVACTASAGILFSSKSAALECAKAKDGIVVNTVLVGPVEGETSLPYGADVEVIPPAAVADAVLFYSTDGAVYMSGMDLPLDGGFLAQ